MIPGAIGLAIQAWAVIQAASAALGLGAAAAGGIGGSLGHHSFNVNQGIASFNYGMAQFAGGIGPIIGVWNAEEYAMTTEIG